jgi:DNA-binding transcriptional regulator YiaG
MTPAALKSIRQALGITPADAARYAGVERRSWDRWEDGTHPVPGPIVALVTLWRWVPGAADYSRTHRVSDNKE